MPGNFHIAMHNYVGEYQMLMAMGIYKPDFSHIVNKLEFGEIESS